MPFSDLNSNRMRHPFHSCLLITSISLRLVWIQGKRHRAHLSTGGRSSSFVENKRDQRDDGSQRVEYNLPQQPKSCYILNHNVKFLTFSRRHTFPLTPVLRLDWTPYSSWWDLTWYTVRMLLGENGISTGVCLLLAAVFFNMGPSSVHFVPNGAYFPVATRTLRCALSLFPEQTPPHRFPWALPL